MLEVVDFKKEHFRALDHSEATTFFDPFIKDEHLELMENSPYSRSFINKDGKVVACCGLIVQWENRAEAWAMLSKTCRHDIVSLHRWVDQMMEAAPIRRIEAPVVANYRPGIRWVEMLGFKKESDRLRAYFPNGADAIMYARVK